ncbi:UPF0598 protein CG30010 [Diabrotica undecimpunctata]|uniref:UPF0598 protein CG30010 n=1 Tax=Diabrotica undecimpunctata TaxID=50387 RepID=UPI003B63519A
MIKTMNRYLKSFLTLENKLINLRHISYIQGQSPEPKVREYFYYIDHQGMLFLDDARMKNFTSCFKEKKFLRFFFNQLRINTTARYQEFPYISLCGKERNFVRCDDYPIVYTHIVHKTDPDEIHLGYNHAGDLLTTKFLPDKVIMLPETGRVYHPCSDKIGGVGLVASKLAIEFSKSFTFENGDLNPPTHFTFENITYDLDSSWYQKANKVER